MCLGSRVPIRLRPVHVFKDSTTYMGLKLTPRNKSSVRKLLVLRSMGLVSSSSRSAEQSVRISALLVEAE